MLDNWTYGIIDPEIDYSYKNNIEQNELINSSMNKELPLEEDNIYIGKKNKNEYIKYSFYCKECNTSFIDDVHSLLPICPICKPNWKFSKIEIEIVNYIKSFYSGNILMYKRDLIDNIEIDIYIPEFKLAIDVKNLYWNSYNRYREKFNIYEFIELSREKHIKCSNIGIRLITIWDYYYYDELFVTKFKIFLKNIILAPIKIGARKCSIKEIEKTIADDFCEKYHMLGKYRSKKNTTNLGIFYNNILLGISQFRNLKTNYECVRYCFKSNYRIIGALNKIFKHFNKRVFHIIDLNFFIGKSHPLGNNWDSVHMLYSNKPHEFISYSVDEQILPREIDYYQYCLEEKRWIIPLIGYNIKWFDGSTELFDQD